MRKRLFAVPAILLASLLTAGCPQSESRSGGAGAAAGNEIPVGEYSSLTGTTATFGQSTHNGILLALEEINAAGGVNGKQLRLYAEDTQSKPEEAAVVVQKLISQNGVVAVLGEVASSRSLAAAPICQSNKVPMISPSSTNPQVTEIGDFIFRACFLDSYQGESLAKFAVNELKAKRAAVLTDVKNDYSVGLAKFFEETFTKMGGQIVARQSYSEGDSDFRAQLTGIRASNPEVIFVPGYYTEVGQIAIQSRDLGMKQPLIGGDGWESPKLVEIGGKALDGSFYSNHYTPDDPDPRVQNFVQKYEQKFGARPDSLAALAYDSAKILAEAMKRAKTLDGPSIRDEIAKTSGFEGVTGAISMGGDRNPVKDLVILEIRDGKTLKRAEMSPATPAAGM